MRRWNIQMAFVGEGTDQNADDASQLVEGDEAVEIEVRSGKVLVTVPAGTPDEQVFDKLSILSGELVLENGQTISFEIQDGATGAQFMATETGLRDDTHAGLSSVPDVPGGA